MTFNEFQKIKRELTKILKSAYVVSKQHKNIFSQLAEMVYLRFKNEFGLSEYYDFRLWDDHLYTRKEKLDYVGWRAEQKLDELGNLKEYFGLANDKFIFYTLMKFLFF